MGDLAARQGCTTRGTGCMCLRLHSTRDALISAAPACHLLARWCPPRGLESTTRRPVPILFGTCLRAAGLYPRCRHVKTIRSRCSTPTHTPLRAQLRFDPWHADGFLRARILKPASAARRPCGRKRTRAGRICARVGGGPLRGAVVRRWRWYQACDMCRPCAPRSALASAATGASMLRVACAVGCTDCRG